MFQVMSKFSAVAAAADDPMVTAESTMPSRMVEIKLVESERDGGGQMDIGQCVNAWNTTL